MGSGGDIAAGFGHAGDCKTAIRTLMNNQTGTLSTSSTKQDL
jgi:hypothetical protein